jgi:hypothetical protein
MELRLVRINNLYLHEETQPELLEKLVKNLQIEKTIRHPIIVDRNSLVVLDGTHRTEALKTLNYNHIPACMVDYMDHNIKLAFWYRTINANKSRDLLSTLEKIDMKMKKMKEGENNESSKKALITFVSGESFLLFEDAKVITVYNYLKEFEKKIRGSCFKVYYDTKEDAFRKLKENKSIAIFAAPRATKEAVIKTALARERFPWKTTRHIIPGRPMGINCPLKFLKNPLICTNKKFVELLNNKRLKVIPAGSSINSRKYEEPIILFR